MILLYDSENQWLTIEDIAGGYSKVIKKGIRIPIGSGMIGHVAETGQTLMSGEVSKDPYYVADAGSITKSELSVPIKSGDKVIGVLDIQSDQLFSFDKSDLEAMETLCTQITTAIENARLFEQSQRRSVHASMIYNVGERVSSQLEVDSLLSEIVTTVRDTFNYYGVMLMLLNEETKRLVLQSIVVGMPVFSPMTCGWLWGKG